MKRKYGFICGALVTTLLLVSNASALVVKERTDAETNQTLMQGESLKSVPYFDPEIYLTTDDLPMLYTCLAATNDPEITQLIQDIIDIIEDQGYASNEDIQQLELPESLGSSMSGVNFPVGIINAVDTSGTFYGVRLFHRFIFCGPVFLWQITLHNGGYLTINGQGICGPATINMPLFIGYGYANPGGCISGGDPWIYRIRGIGFGINVESTSSSPSSKSQPTTYTTTSTKTYATRTSPTNN